MDEMKNATPGDAPLTDSEKSFNRQVNYYVMRRMWQVIRKRNSGVLIHEIFGTSRERINRVIDSGTIRYGKSELRELVETTGLRREIFTGEVRFQCLYIGRNGEKADITQEEWEELFRWRTDKSNMDSSIEKKIREKLRKTDITDRKNWDFYQLCFFIKELKVAPKKAVTEQVAEITRAVMGLSFSVLDECDTISLQRLHKVLMEKTKLINGIITYKQARDKK